MSSQTYSSVSAAGKPSFFRLLPCCHTHKRTRRYFVRDLTSHQAISCVGNTPTGFHAVTFLLILYTDSFLYDRPAPVVAICEKHKYSAAKKALTHKRFPDGSRVTSRLQECRVRRNPAALHQTTVSTQYLTLVPRGRDPLGRHQESRSILVM